MSKAGFSIAAKVVVFIIIVSCNTQQISAGERDKYIEQEILIDESTIPIPMDASVQTVTLEETDNPAPTVVPTETLSPTPRPAPTPFVPDTLKVMEEHDYVKESVSGITTKKLSIKTLKSRVSKFGTLYGQGMPYQEYKDAMNYKWSDKTVYNKKPVWLTVDITKTMNYKSYESTLQMLSRYDGVYLYKIGESTDGRNLYAIEIDVESEEEKDVYILTGQIHAREFAGGTFLLKQLVDLVQKAQTDEKVMDLLKNNKFAAVPIINVDGREALINQPGNWTTKGGELWKAYANGTDGNRNFPGLLWGQVSKGNSLRWDIAKRPAYGNYPGDHAGCNSETKSMMKWIYHYVAIEQAVCHLDYHQQGSLIYAGKGWQTKKQEKQSTDIRPELFGLLNENRIRKYTKDFEKSKPGFDGKSSSITDYSVSVAVGAKFSPAYGFAVFTDEKKEYTLLEVGDLDKAKFEVEEANDNFACVTLEIGYGTKYLGNSAKTRILHAKEYKNYHFGSLLEELPGIVK